MEPAGDRSDDLPLQGAGLDEPGPAMEPAKEEPGDRLQQQRAMSRLRAMEPAEDRLDGDAEEPHRNALALTAMESPGPAR
jgi:hypothetical protein